MSLLDGFVMRAALAGVGAALAAAPLGCFLIWRRMAFFGDAAAHAAVLGVALALAAEAPIRAGVLLAALAMAAGLALLSDRGRPADTILSVLSHGALASGLVAIALAPGSVDIEGLLFGDILASSRSDLAVIWAGVLAVGGLMAWRWQRLLTATLNPDLAIASGIDPARERAILTLALAIVVAVAIEVVGALLISALMIVPAAAARAWADGPERMAGIAAALGVTATLAGLGVSWFADTPTGPTIVCAAVAIFALSLAKRSV